MTHTLDTVEGYCETCEHHTLKIKLYGENRSNTPNGVQIECEQCGEWLSMSYVRPGDQKRVNNARQALEE